MFLYEFAFLVIVSFVVGFIGQFVIGASKGGCPVSVTAAFVGGFAGPRLARWLDYPEPWVFTLGDATFQVGTAVGGALILALLVNLATRGRTL